MPRTNSRLRRALMIVAASVPLVLLMLLPLAAARESNPTDGLRYIALGDSIPSGNAFPTDETRPCQRNADSYPWLLSQQLAVSYESDAFTFNHLACSGARIAVGEDEVIDRCLDTLGAEARDNQTTACQLKWLPYQVDDALDLLDGRPSLVTITIGANDTGWTDPLGLISLMLATDSEFRDEIDAVSSNVETALAAQIERLVTESNATVIVTDIYNPFNADSVLFQLALTAQASAWGAENVGEEPCTGTDRNGVEHRLSCTERAEYGLQALSASIRNAVAGFPERVFAVTLIDAFRGHEAPAGTCGDAEPGADESWIRETASGGIVPFPDCFHPNTAGAEAIASLILSAWQEHDES